MGNAISYNPILDQIVLSSRHMNEFFVIDHSTTSIEAISHSGGDSGKGGDLYLQTATAGNTQTTAMTIAGTTQAVSFAKV